MTTALQFLNITSSLITVAGIVFVIQLIFKWLNNPRFSVGVLPSGKEQKEEGISALGKASLFDEFTFDKSCLAKELKNESEIASLKFDNDSARSVYRDSSGYVKLPMIIQNDGRSEAKGYTLVLYFSHPEIRVAAVHTESLQIECLYTQDDSFIKDKSLTGKVPAVELRDIYRDLNLVSDYLCLQGSLASRTFEAIYLQLHVPDECCDFFLLFKIDCPDFIDFRRRVFGQFINVFKGKNS